MDLGSYRIDLVFCCVDLGFHCVDLGIHGVDLGIHGVVFGVDGAHEDRGLAMKLVDLSLELVHALFQANEVTENSPF